jgi:uncharacterized protein YwgA
MRMTRYQLAKIVDWAGTLESRKRMQKAVYLLQVAGCPLEAEFNLHHYGPYSQDVARLSDEMVQAGLLEEKAVPNMRGQQYSYRLAESARQRLADIESDARSRSLAEQLAPFEAKARGFFKADLKTLEVASTMVFFRKQGHDWPTTLEKTCQFKELTEDCLLTKNAEGLARQIVD